MLSIQYLRGLAALGVATIHALEQVTSRAEVPALQFCRGGVDMAFVISGFIMWHVLLSRPLSPWAFLRRRLLRIVPLYWAVTGLMVLVMLAAPRFVQTARFDAPHVLAAFLLVAWPSPVPGAGMRPVLMPAWTLDLEMLFYLVVATALWLPRRTQQLATIAFLLVLAACGPLLAQLGPIAGFYSNPVIVEFALGIGIAILLRRVATAPWWLAVTMIVVGAISLVLCGNQINSAESNRLLVFGPGVTVLVAGLVLLECGSRLPRFGSLRRIGDASYSIYLTHGLLLSAWAQLWKHSRLTTLPPALFVVFALAGSIALGIAVNRVVERPMRKLQPGFAMRRPAGGAGQTGCAYARADAR